MSLITPIAPLAGGYFSGKTLVQLAEALRGGRVSALELTEQALADIAIINPSLNAFTYVAEKQARHNAAEADRLLAEGQDLGILHGIPIGIKDNIMTAGMPTTMGSAHFRDWVPEQDASCVGALKRAGGVIIAKTTTHEFAYGPTGDCSFQGATHNPWDRSKMAGGSSCGSAAAVAAGMLPVALGTDTGGSVRIPAALTGVVGFKPSYGALSTEGVFPLSRSLDHVGIITGTPADAAAVFAVLAPAVEKQCQVELDGLNLRWVSPEPFGTQDPLVIAAVKAWLGSACGRELPAAEEVAGWSAELQQILGQIQKSEAYEIHAERVAGHPELFQPEVLQRLRASREVRGWEYVRARERRETLSHRFAQLFETCDLLLMPTVAIRTPHLYDRKFYLDGRVCEVRDTLLSLTSIWNLLGLPAVSIPCGLLNGMPLGCQLIAAQGRDRMLLDAAQQLLAAGS
ncbi:amidase [Serratia entomophila]|uniref:amidase n=1 Tax=Serratia entomophila TaxID=42906 RepID=UPI0021772EF7|nr:amidase [Serratia entomophila]CAI1737626.1 Glutamyl-tRNA(Gln) amidotransferase subunit A [Serratia entomophila]